MDRYCPSTRRCFLRGSVTTLASALVAPTIIRSSIDAAEPKTSPADRITIGMIGTGRQAMAYNFDSFLTAHDAQIVAVCDVDAWRLENARQKVEKHYAGLTQSGKFRGCDVYRDFRELLERDDIDAVMISTPDHWHAIPAVEAATGQPRE